MVNKLSGMTTHIEHSVVGSMAHTESSAEELLEETSVPHSGDNDTFYIPQDEATEFIFASELTTIVNISSDPRDVEIKVYNKSSTAQPFMLHPSAPEFKYGDQPNNLCTCIYASSNKIAPYSGRTTLVIAVSSEFDKTFTPSQLQPIYAVTGLADSALKPGVKMDATDALLLNEHNSSCMMVMPENSAPQFDTSYRGAAEKALFRIKVGTGFEYPQDSHPFIGLGIPKPRSKSSEIVCVAVWEAVPGSTYNFRPSDDWKCSRGYMKPGTAIDLQDWPATKTIKVDKSGEQWEIHYEDSGVLNIFEAQ
jgi:hypothetical protein